MHVSYGLLMFVRDAAGLSVLLVHPGGPFWRNKDDGAWSIPKGLANEGEDGLTAAQREFFEETGLTPRASFIAGRSKASACRLRLARPPSNSNGRRGRAK
jgi:predicted NUDIX family NTP pyrophosphohydrolase